MKNSLIYITLLFILLLINGFAQSSIHQRDKLKHEARLNNDTTTIQKKPLFNSVKSNSSLTKNVFGYLPYWEYLSNDNLTIRFDLLSHIAIFDFWLTESGNLSNPLGWFDSWQPLIEDAHENNVKIILTISNLTSENVDSILVSNLINNENTQKVFFEEIKERITTSNAYGINLDFENIKLRERAEPITSFTRELRDSLDTWFTGKELSFATPAVNWGNRWNLEGLAEICDYLFIMAYDFYGSWSTTTGPVAPLEGFSKNYKTIVTEDYANIDPSKLILGVPYYGAQWRVPTEKPYQTVIPQGHSNSNWTGHVDYRFVDEWIIKNILLFDDSSKSTYYTIPVENEYQLTWIDSDTSLALKYDLINEYYLRGAGIWSLGKDGAREELWNLIDEKFGENISDIKNDEYITKDFTLYQNYPNPFNPSTSIKYRVRLGSPEARRVSRRETVTLKVFDILGREIKTLVNKVHTPGNYTITFNASGLPSGVYIYKLQAGEFIQTCKMMLLK